MSNNNSERVVRRGRVFPEIQATEEEKAKHRARQLEFYHRCWPIFQSLQPRLMKHYYGWSKKWLVKKQGQNIPTKSIISLALMKLELVAEYD